MRLLSNLAIGCLLLAATMPAFAGPVTVGGPWYEFEFGGVGTWAFSDPGGLIPSSGGNSVFADDPPWTLTAGAAGALLTVTDAWSKGDAFEIFDSSVSIGSTPLVASVAGSVSDPAICVLDPTISHAVFSLAAGPHSITIQTIASPYGSGGAYFRADNAGAGAIPAPSALLLVMSGLLGAFPWRRRAAH